jgi:hypothetical protein
MAPQAESKGFTTLPFRAIPAGEHFGAPAPLSVG